MDNPIIVALDGIGFDRANAIAERLKDDVWGFKINDLFFEHGLAAVCALSVFGPVMLDGKFHDIPNTVKNTTEKIAALCDPGIVTVHASGGGEMIRTAAENLPGKVAAVTVLTSHSPLSTRVNYGGTPEAVVRVLAEQAELSGAAFLVCSPNELAILSDINLPKIVPGIRPNWYKTADDQQRVATPVSAMAAGAKFLVMGRPILRADDPVEAAQKTLKEIKKG